MLALRRAYAVALCTITAAVSFASPATSFFRNHCLFIHNGYLKSESATPSQILADYHNEAEGKPIVIHFHGGLVSEDNAKKEAIDLNNGCYAGATFPVFFIWNADFWSQFGNILESRYHDVAYLQGHLSTAAFLKGLHDRVQNGGINIDQAKASGTQLLAAYRRFMSKDPAFQKAVVKQALQNTVQQVGTTASDWMRADTWIKARDNIQKNVTDYFSPYVQGVAVYHDKKSVSWGGDILEWVASNLGGRDIWSEMKRETRTSFESNNRSTGAGMLFLRALARERHLPRIVLVGHSTGCIYILNFLKAAKQILPGVKFDVIFLAPANTYRDTAAFLTGYRDEIRNFRMFGIRDADERKDHMLWTINPQLEGLYPGSLLYFVSRSVEARHNMPVLGLQRDYTTPISEPDRTANLTVRRYLLDAPGHVVWSPNFGTKGLACTCVSHGDFCSDGLTLRSLRYLVRSPVW
jgi:hypothetical protein